MSYDIQRLCRVATYLFSRQAATQGRYDERDLLLGHGLDNLVSMRVIFVLSLVVLLGLWVNFFISPDFYSTFSFALVFSFLCWYVRHLPACGITDSLHLNELEKTQAYRSYLHGRILFTPHGLSLSWHKRKIVKVPLSQAFLQNTDLIQPYGIVKNTQVLQQATNYEPCQAASAHPQHLSHAHITQHTQSHSPVIPHTSVQTHVDGSSLNPHETATNQLQPSLAAVQAQADLASITHGQPQPSLATAQTQADLAASTLGQPQPHLTQRAPQPINPQADSITKITWKNSPLVKFGKKLYALWSAPESFIEVQVDSHQQQPLTPGEISNATSGYLTWPDVQSLYGYRLLAGMRLRLDQLQDLTEAMLPSLSLEAHRDVAKDEVFFLGFGFNWYPKHTRRLHDVLEVGVRPSPFGGKGTKDIHAVEDHDAYNPLFFAREMLQGHTMIFGTTGAGKTRMFDLLVTQAILRGDAVIIIDPKGDHGLQECLLRAMRMAKREPTVELFCLDIALAHHKSFTPRDFKVYTQISTGRRFPQVGLRKGTTIPNTRRESIGTKSLYRFIRKFPRRVRCDLLARRAYKVRTNKAYYDRYRIANAPTKEPVDWMGRVPLPHSAYQENPHGIYGNWDEELSQQHNAQEQNSQEQDSLLTRTPNSAEFYQQHKFDRQQVDKLKQSPNFATDSVVTSEYKRSAFDSVESNPDLYAFKYFSQSFNPLSTYGRSTEVADRVCAMMPDDGGSASSFKGYALMAVAAAVDCLQLTGQKVTLANIRSIVSDQSKFINGVRCGIDTIVRKRNKGVISYYYNCIHGVRLSQLQRFAGTVSALLGSQLDQPASRSKELLLLKNLVRHGILNPGVDKNGVQYCEEKYGIPPSPKLTEASCLSSIASVLLTEFQHSQQASPGYAKTCARLYMALGNALDRHPADALKENLGRALQDVIKVTTLNNEEQLSPQLVETVQQLVEQHAAEEAQAQAEAEAEANKTKKRTTRAKSSTTKSTRAKSTTTKAKSTSSKSTTTKTTRSTRSRKTTSQDESAEELSASTTEPIPAATETSTTPKKRVRKSTTTSED